MPAAGVFAARNKATRQKLSDSTRDGTSEDAINRTVTHTRTSHTPHHHKHRLETLPQHLHRKADVPSCFVLASAGMDLARRDC